LCRFFVMAQIMTHDGSNDDLEAFG